MKMPIFHPHLHAIVSDGLFRKNGTFYALPTCEMKQLEEIFRSMILTMLKRKGKIADDLIQKLMNWRPSIKIRHPLAMLARHTQTNTDSGHLPNRQMVQ